MSAHAGSLQAYSGDLSGITGCTYACPACTLGSCTRSMHPALSCLRSPFPTRLRDAYLLAACPQMSLIKNAGAGAPAAGLPPVASASVASSGPSVQDLCRQLDMEYVGTVRACMHACMQSGCITKGRGLHCMGHAAKTIRTESCRSMPCFGCV